MIIENQVFSEEIPEKGATNGHIKFHVHSSKPEDIALVGFCANIAASLLFEKLQSQGTNIIFTLDKSKASIDVLGRSEDDGLNLLWTPKEATQEQLSSMQERIRNKTFFLGKESKSETKQEQKPEHKTEVKSEILKTQIPKPAETESEDEEEEDYLIKQLHRIP